MNFSIILPTYNRANFISSAIKSVIDQTFQNWELIIVDDGSTDVTKKIVKEFINIENRIIYFQQKNKERSAARNNGIRHANGEWICFLDSDDIYNKNHLQEFYNLINKNNFNKGLYFSGMSKNDYCESIEEYDLSHKNNLEFVLLNSIGTPRACVAKKILLEHKFNEKLRIGEDRELWSRILIKYPLYLHSKKTFIEIEHNERSINTADFNSNLKILKFIIKKNKSFIRKKIKRKVLSNAYFNISKKFILNGKNFISIYYLIISIFYNLKNKKTNHKLLLIFHLTFNFKNGIFKQYIRK